MTTITTHTVDCRNCGWRDTVSVAQRSCRNCGALKPCLVEVEGEQCAHGATPPYTNACEADAVRDGMCENHARVAEDIERMYADYVEPEGE